MASFSRRNDVVQIKFISDEDVLGHIVHINDKRKKSTGSEVKKQLDTNDLTALYQKTTSADFPNELNQVKQLKPTVLLEDIGKGLVGSDVFSFKKSGTPRTQNAQLREKAIASAQKATERARESKSINSSKSKTPKNKKEKASAPNKSRRSSRRRINIKQCLAETSEDSEFSESASASSSSESEEETVSTNTRDAKTRVTPAVQRKGRKKLDDTIQTNPAEAYFAAHGSAAPTSDHTLSRLENPKLDHSSVISILKNLPHNHAKEIEKLNLSYKEKFRKWMFQLSENFNLLLYGIGSKRKLMLLFQETIEEAEGLVINGFFPNITVKGILSYIIDEVLNKTYQGQDQLEFIKNSMEEESKDLYIFFHNIDGTVLRSEKAQNILSQLALIKGIHIVASIDHINAPLIWDQSRLSRFNWLWYNVTTFEPYTNETAFENSLLMQPSSELVLSSLIHVFRSLNPKAKGIFLLLAKNQLENVENTNYVGMSYQDCYHKCREAFLVNSDLTMRAQLTEFKDHKLMKSKKGSDGIEYLTIPLEATTLTEFVTEYSKN